MPLIIGLIPPWAVLSALIGLVHGSLFHVLFGAQIRQLPLAVIIAIVASVLGGLLGTMIPPAIVELGDTNLIATTIAAWLALGIARLFRFC